MMALAIGTITKNSTDPSGAVSISFSHTQAVGDDGYLYLLINKQTLEKTPNSVTYDGATMTLVEETVTETEYDTKWILYELASPSTGSNTVTLNFTQYEQYGAIYSMVISSTGSSGSGSRKLTQGVYGDPSVEVDLASVGSGSTVFLSCVGNAIDTFTMTIDGTNYADPFEWNFTRFSAEICADYKENVSSGNNSVTTTTASVAGYAFEIKSAGGTPSTYRDKKSVMRGVARGIMNGVA